MRPGELGRARGVRTGDRGRPRGGSNSRERARVSGKSINYVHFLEPPGSRAGGGSAALVAGLPVFPLAGLDVGNRNGNEVAAILERSDMVSFEAAGTVARSTAPAVALEGGVADASPPGSLQRSQAHAGARLSNSLSFSFQDKSPFPIR